MLDHVPPAYPWGTMAKKAENKPTLMPGAEARVILLTGPDSFLRVEHVSQHKILLEREFGGLDVFQFDGEGIGTSATDVLDECRSFGLMSAHKLVIVDNALAMIREETRPLFERYVQAPSDQATLILRSATWRAGNLDKMIEANGAIVHCESPDPLKAMGWATKRAERRHRATLKPDAARLLVTLLGPDLARLDTELGKLAAAGALPDGSSVITAESVRTLIQDEREDDLYTIQSEFLSPDPEVVLSGLRNLLDVAREPFPRIQFALTDLAKKLHVASVLCSEGKDPRMLRLWGSGVERIYEMARRTTPSAAAALYMDCLRADSASKSGSDPERLLEALSIRFARFAAHPTDA